MRPDHSKETDDESAETSQIARPDDDGEWQEMPVIRSDDVTNLDEEDRKKFHYISRSSYTHTGEGSGTNATGNRIISATSALSRKEAAAAAASAGGKGNLTSDDDDTTTTLTPHQNILDGISWREKSENLEETDYTRVLLDEDHETDEVHLRTQYLFSEDREMTPLSQMHATKNLLTEGQRIAYVGLCRLITRSMIQSVRGRKDKSLEHAAMAMDTWAQRIMTRLYKHMDVSSEEQMMIELLGEHGLTATDLVPALRATHTVPNPEFEPDESKRMHFPSSRRNSESDDNDEDENDGGVEDVSASLTSPNKVGFDDYPARASLPTDQPVPEISRKDHIKEPDKEPLPEEVNTEMSSHNTSETIAQESNIDDVDVETEDISGIFTEKASLKDKIDPSKNRDSLDKKQVENPDLDEEFDISCGNPENAQQGTKEEQVIQPNSDMPSSSKSDQEKTPKDQSKNIDDPLPNALPGVSTTLTDADEMVILDIRWTVLCDLFLALISEATYDSRSRVLLGAVADKLELGWNDVVRFERRITEALEIQEGVSKGTTKEAIEKRRIASKKKRIMMMGLATLGGGLVIGLSAGVLAPLIGAGLGAAFTTVGITGTASFLGGTGGAAIITTGGVMTGSALAGRGMAKRTKDVSHFEFKPIHNNRRVNALITVPGFMEGKADDVRLPFSVLDPVIGDVFSILWEPEMMGETGNALRILTSEVLTQVGQQVLAATVMATLMSALQWPIILTKLSYLIDNPWSNALDRARAAGAVLADILMHRQLGDRPVSLIGFSLGARVIFYCMLELAKAKAFGVVQDVYLIGTTVSAPQAAWQQVRATAPGRVVNVYAKNDWLLAYLFRMSHGGMSTVSGLRPVEGIDGVENVDVSDVVTGHMSYRALMPLLLERLEFKVTADHFDEPDEIYDPGAEEEEEKKKKKRFFNFGSWKRKPDKSSTAKEEDGEDKLPAREEMPQTGEQSAQDSESGEEKSKNEVDSHPEMTPRPEPVAPAMAGFNLEELKKEIAKEDQVPEEDRVANSLPTEAQQIPPSTTPKDSQEILEPNTPNIRDVGADDELFKEWEANAEKAIRQLDSDRSDSSPKPTLTFADADGNLGSDEAPALSTESPIESPNGLTASKDRSPSSESSWFNWGRGGSKAPTTSSTPSLSTPLPPPTINSSNSSDKSFATSFGDEITRPAMTRPEWRPSRPEDTPSDSPWGSSAILSSNPWAADVPAAPARARSGSGRNS